jgi:hypothetical protein
VSYTIGLSVDNIALTIPQGVADLIHARRVLDYGIGHQLGDSFKVVFYLRTAIVSL